ncbi:hypothetical protein GGQ64_002592 [Rhizobium azooxidifex]|uniref:Uncharacterized protein n=1 Tax=Mycoplana azooxidifex TaxID=1636188 RepID=A0A7W6GIV7_9HYPH|nr:hypothetical protein [Mycoplana azooxidifex]MBB3977386.1 hypothetical protein [Mycoplana azooxidifex]
MTRDEHGLDDNRLLAGEVELWRNDQWRVTNFVLEEVPGATGYWIAARDVHHEMWPAHMSTKQWVDHSSFIEALHQARELHPRQGEVAA